MTDPLRGISIRNAGPRSAEVLVYETIGQDFWTGEGLTAKAFAESLKTFGELDLIKVRINSGGGLVSDALAIFNTLRSNGARIEVDIDGSALSSASVIAMAGHEVRMADNALMMIHDPWTYARGSADDMRKAADMLDKTKESLITTYQDKARIRSRDEIAEAMAAETWFSAEEAKAFGIVDQVTKGMKIAAHAGEWKDRIPDRLKSVINQSEGRGADADLQETHNMSTEKEKATEPAPPKAATLAELKSLAGSTAEQREAWQEKGLTLAQATQEHMATLSAKLDAQAKEVEALKAKTETTAPLTKVGIKALPEAGVSLTAGTTGDPIAAWHEAVDAERKRGRDRSAAVRNVVRNNPELHQQFIAASNERARANGYGQRPSRR